MKYLSILTLAAKFLSFLSIVFISVNDLFAQSPTNIPRQESEPVQFFDSWENVVIYLIIPLAIIILYYIWKKKSMNKK
ncbi:MAG: hypothetical protein ACOC4J_01320 [Bacteroidota bacterium]